MGYVTIELDVDECPGVNQLEHVSFTIALICGKYYIVPGNKKNIKVINYIS